MSEAISRIWPGYRTRTAVRLPVRDAAVLAGGHAAAGRLLRQVLRVQRRDPGPPLLGSPSSASVLSVVGAYYYLRIVKIMYFDEPRAQPSTQCPASVQFTLGLSAIFVILFVLAPSTLKAAADVASRSLF